MVRIHRCSEARAHRAADGLGMSPRGLRGASRRRTVRVLGLLLAAWLLLPTMAQASPGCQAVNGRSGVLSAFGYDSLLDNDQPVNEGDLVTFTATNQAQYVGSFINLIVTNGTVSAPESHWGASGDNVQDLSGNGTSYHVTCASIGPSASGLTPSSGSPGTLVTITGSGFYGAQSVQFGGQPAPSFTVVSANTITATVPTTAPLSGAVTVTTDGGSASGGVFTLVAPSANPVSMSVAANSGGNAVALGLGWTPTALGLGSAAAHGSVSISGLSVTYTPAVGFSGTDAFSIVAHDGPNVSATVPVTVTVTAPTIVIAPGVLPAVQAYVPYSKQFTASGSGSVYTFSATGLPAGLTMNPSGLLSGTPTQTGTFSVQVTAFDGSGFSGSATYTLTINPPSSPSVAAATASTAYKTPVSIDLSSAITGNAITAVTTTTPAHGTVSVSGETVTYTPSATFYGGTDSFTYTATNAGGTSTPATVTVTVASPGAPGSSARAVQTAYNTAATIDLSGAIVGAGITGISVATTPTHGTVSVSGETVTYTPSPTFYGGSDSFAYTATNAGGTSAPATVTITVGAPPAPTVAAASATTAYATATTIDLSSSISGVDITAISVGTPPTHGTVSVSGLRVTYTPASTFYGGTDSFTYVATNPGGSSAPATVTMTVTALSVPVANAMSVTTTTGTPVLINAEAGVAGGQQLTGVSVASQPAHGRAEASGGQITYTPAAGFVGTDTFTYAVSNHFGASTPATLTVTVTRAGRAAASGGTVTVTTTPGTAVSANLAGVATGSYVSSVVVGQSPGNAGSVMVTSPTALSFTPASGFRGLAQITVLLTDSNGAPTTVDVLVLVSSQPDPSKDPDVLGLVRAQTTQAQRFAQSQLDNIHGRLDSLHDGGSAPLFSNTLSVSLGGKPLQGGALGVLAAPSGNGAIGLARPGMGVAEGTVDALAATPAPTPAGDTRQGSNSARSAPEGLGVWVGGSANFGSFDSYRQASGFDSDAIAVNVGVDQRIGHNALVGFTLGYNHDNADIANDGTRSIAQGYSAAMYASYQPMAQVYIDAVIGGGGLDFRSRRRDADTGGYLTGSRTGQEWFGSLTAGYEYQRPGGLALSPYLRLEQTLSTLNGYDEQGDVTGALSYGRQFVRTSLAVLGLRASEEFRLAWGTLIPRARLEVGHDFQGTSDTSLSYAFIPSAGSWNVLSNPYTANGTSAQLGLGLDVQLPRNLLLTTEYQYLAQPHAHDQMIRFSLNKSF